MYLSYLTLIFWSIFLVLRICNLLIQICELRHGGANSTENILLGKVVSLLPRKMVEVTSERIWMRTLPVEGVKMVPFLDSLHSWRKKRRTLEEIN